MIKAILWDNDGVLVDTERLYYLATRQILATVGVSLSQEQYRELFLIQNTGAWRLVEEKGLGLLDIERLRHERNTLYSQLLRQEPLFIEGAAEVLEALSKKYLMGMVTSSRRDHLDLIYQTADILQYFTFVIAGDDCTNLKPHPEPYLRAVERSGHLPELCLAIEDSERGLASATAAGIRCVVVPNELTRECNFTGAYKVLSNLSELVTIL